MINYDKVGAFIGRPWVYGVCDCWSIYKEASLAVFGIKIHDVDIPITPNTALTISIFEDGAKSGKWEKIDQPVPGAACLFRNARGHATHIGLYITRGNVLHSRGVSATYDRLDDIIKQTDLKTCEFYQYVATDTYTE